MGLLGGIGNFISGAAKTVSGIAGKVADFGGKALSVIQKPMETLTAPVKKLAGGLLDKLPFGLGKIAKPFVEKLIDSGASFLASGPLGGLGFLGKAAKTVQDVVKIAETVKGIADKVGAFANNPLGQANAQNLLAYAHAQHIQ
jgi:phage-related protein